MNDGAFYGRLTGVLGALVAFGVLYNMFAAWMEREGYREGYIWLEVVIGVAVTGIAYGILVDDLRLFELLFLCFLADGIPVCVGACYRYMKARKQEQKHGD